MDNEIKKQLIAHAIQARKHAYAPFSQFAVGASLLAADGSITIGANVENSSYGLTICAERVAVGTAVAAGQRNFTAIAVASAGGVSPCGACRQVLAQFVTDMQVFLVDTHQPDCVREFSLTALLPEVFVVNKCSE